MFLSLFFFHSFSALVGIDIGSEYMRASVLRPGKPIEIVLDSNSKRVFSTVMTIIPTKSEIPDCINYSEVNDYEYIMNDQYSIRKYPNSTIHHWSNFIAKLAGKSISELALKRHFYAPITKHFNDRALITGLFPEIVFHRSLPLINESTLHMDPNAVIKSSVISVPKFWPQQERDAVRSIARSLKFSPFVVDSTRSISTYFAIENSKSISKKPISVAFFDFGASNLQISISQFVKKPKLQIKELAYDFDDAIGGRDIDIIIYDLLVEKYYKEKNIKRANNDTHFFKFEQILLAEANKIKHRLTTDSSISSYIEEMDYTYQIDRAEFEEAISPILTKIKDMIVNITKDNTVDRVHMVGGSSRIPIIQSVVKELFKVDRLMFSLNVEEASAIGAAYVGAGKNSDFMLQQVDYIPLTLFNTTIRTKETKYPFNGTIPEIGKPHWISNDVKGKKYPIGSSVYLAWSNTNESTKLSMTKDGLHRFKNGTQGNTHPWKIHTLDIASEIEKKEAAKAKLEETVNRLEKLLLDTKMTLSEETKLNQMSTENERKALSVAISVTDRWFLKQQKFEQESIENRLNMLEDAVGSVMCRVQNFELLPEAEKNMTGLIKAINKTITKNWMLKSEKKRPKRREIRTLLRKVVEYKIWHDELAEIQKNLAPTDSPALLWNEIRDKVNEIGKFYEEMKDKAMGRQPKEKNENVYVYPPSSANVKID